MLTRHTLILHAVVLLFWACQRDAAVQAEENGHTVILAGQVKGYSSDLDLYNFRVYSTDIFDEQYTHIVDIDEDGEFKLVLEEMYPQEYYFKPQTVPGWKLYAQPGDSLFLTIDPAMLSDSLSARGAVYDYLSIAGDNLAMSQDYMKWQRFLTDSVDTREQSRLSRDTTITHWEFREYVDAFSDSLHVRLAHFNRENQTCDQFRNYAANYLKFDRLDALLWFVFHQRHVRGYKRSYTMPQEYLSFMKGEEWNDEKMVISSRYKMFLHDYILILRNYQNSELLGEEIKEAYKSKNFTKAYRLNMIHLDERLAGFAREVAMANELRLQLKWDQPEIFDSLYRPGLVDHPGIHRYVMTLYDDKMAQLKDPRAFTAKVQTALKRRKLKTFNGIVKKFEGKVVYVDFWAPWCGPCLGEFKYVNKVREEYEGQDLEMVYLCVECEGDDWKETVKEYQVKGRHYALSAEEYGVLSQQLQFTAIPHHLLLDQEGAIVNRNAPGPGKRLKESINKLLGIEEDLEVL